MARREKESRTPVGQGRGSTLLPALSLIASGCLTYANSLSGAFLSDDDLAILSNSSLGQWNLVRILHPARELPVAGRPVVNVSLAVNYALGGVGVAGYHLFNIGVHIVCALILFGIVRRTLNTPRLRAACASSATMLAFAVALIWVVHPLASEPVDFIVQRTESMMACCYLLTLYASIRALDARAWRWSLVSVAACAVGMACKESMVTAPIVVPLYDVIFNFESAAAAVRARWRLYAALASTWILLAALVRSGPRAYSAGFSTRVGVWTYLVNQAPMIVRYLRLTLWPAGLVFWYGPTRPVALSAAWPSAALVAALMAGTAWALIRRPALGFLGAWTFITLAPTSSVLPIATEVGAERRMYLPLMALAALLVSGAFVGWRALEESRFAAALRGRGIYAGGGILALVAILLGGATAVRNLEYRSRLGIARTLVSRWPTGGAHYMVGTELAALDRHSEAVAEYRQAADTFPRARYYLGSELLAAGQRGEALDELRAFVREEPLLSEVIAARTKIGLLLTMDNQWDAGIAEFRRVLSMDPSNADARKLLAGALAHQGHLDEAFSDYRAYLAAHPGDLAATTDFAIALTQSEHDDEEATQMFRRALALDPRNATLHANLARALLLRNDAGGAASEARAALALDRLSPSTYDLLGEALALQGQAADASRQFQEALRLDPSDGAARAALAALQNDARRR